MSVSVKVLTCNHKYDIILRIKGGGKEWTFHI